MSDGHLGKLIAGIHTAICEAHHIAQHQHILELQQHMVTGPDGKPTDQPKTIRIEVAEESGNHIVVDVPEISILPSRSVAIEHVKVKLKVLLEPDGEQKNESREKRGWRLIPKFLMKNDERRDDAVEIEVDFCGCDPPEGYMKAREALDATVKPRVEPGKK